VYSIIIIVVNIIVCNAVVIVLAVHVTLFFWKTRLNAIVLLLLLHRNFAAADECMCRVRAGVHK